MVSFMPRTKSPQYSIEGGWAPELFWMLCRTEKSLASGGVTLLKTITIGKTKALWETEC
jgi:hypothetical protein